VGHRPPYLTALPLPPAAAAGPLPDAGRNVELSDSEELIPPFPLSESDEVPPGLLPSYNPAAQYTGTQQEAVVQPQAEVAAGIADV
jgi:hypothetical protein